MLIAVQHKATTCKDEQASYVYTVEDDSGTREVKFSMPLTTAIQFKSLTPIALHQAYYKQGREVVAQVLNEYYAALAKDGKRDAREKDTWLYRRFFLY